jgi:hypothetical protein
MDKQSASLLAEAAGSSQGVTSNALSLLGRVF